MNAPSALSTAAAEQDAAVIDEEHLGHMTLGDRQLEREVLEIFVRQTVIMQSRLTSVEPAIAAATAHTLLGSACGIGAWRVARAAERVKDVVASKSRPAALDEAVKQLKAAMREAGGAIGARLGGDLCDH